MSQKMWIEDNTGNVLFYIGYSPALWGLVFDYCRDHNISWDNELSTRYLEPMVILNLLQTVANSATDEWWDENDYLIGLTWSLFQRGADFRAAVQAACVELQMEMANNDSLQFTIILC